MSEADDITKALLAGTLGIAQHGLAEPLPEDEDAHVRARARDRLSGQVMDAISRSFRDCFRDMVYPRNQTLVDLFPPPRIGGGLSYPATFEIVERPYRPDAVFDRSFTTDVQIRCGDLLALGPTGEARPVRTPGDARRVFGYAQAASRPLASGRHVVEVGGFTLPVEARATAEDRAYAAEVRSDFASRGGDANLIDDYGALCPRRERFDANASR